MEMSWILQTATMLGIGAIGFFLKKLLDRYEMTFKALNAKIDEIEGRCCSDIHTIRTELNDLKNDLPLVYVLREDFLRVMNNVDNKLDKITNYFIEGRRS